MKTDFFCPRWGSEHIEWETFLQSVKSDGYAGIEWFPYGEITDCDKVLELLKKYDLKFSIVMAVLEDFSFGEYLLELKKQLTELSSLKPLFISTQTGREYFTKEQIKACLQCCDLVSTASGIPIYQETHRNKWNYAVHRTAEILKENPNLLLTLDVSHWFCVSESYLEDQKEAVELAISHARHLHARVGHTQGSQVVDPRLPHYQEALNAHLAIWDKWIEERKKAVDSCTITPEFGPPPYLINTSSKTDHQMQWELNLWMKNFLDKRYN